MKYLRNNYIEENFDKIIKIIDKKKIDINVNYLYIALEDNIDKTIKVNNKYYCYCDKWIAIVMLLMTKCKDSNMITKGYIKNTTPYIKENNKGDINNMINKFNSIYLYEIINTKNFIPIINNDIIYKFYTTKNIVINDKIFINDIFDVLDSQNVKLIYK
jgi:hypothetical protein